MVICAHKNWKPTGAFINVLASLFHPPKCRVSGCMKKTEGPTFLASISNWRWSDKWGRDSLTYSPVSGERSRGDRKGRRETDGEEGNGGRQREIEEAEEGRESRREGEEREKGEGRGEREGEGEWGERMKSRLSLEGRWKGTEPVPLSGFSLNNQWVTPSPTHIGSSEKLINTDDENVHSNMPPAEGIEEALPPLK